MTWHTIPSLPEYEISDETGDVRRATAGRGARAGRVLKNIRIKHSRFLCVSIYQSPKVLHRLAFETFVGPKAMQKHLGKPAGPSSRPLRVSPPERVTHCPYGHAYTKANSYFYKTRNGGQTVPKRMCRTCSRLRGRARTRGMPYVEYLALLEQQKIKLGVSSA